MAKMRHWFSKKLQLENCFNFNTTFSHWQKDIRVVLLFVFLFLLIRFAFIVTFHNDLSHTTPLSESLHCLFVGAKFDARFAIIPIIPFFCLALFAGLTPIHALLDKMRPYWASFWIALTVCLGIADLAFYKEYKDQFNQWIFGILFDDLTAIIFTIYHSYPIFLLFFITTLAFCFFYIILKKALSIKTHKVKKETLFIKIFITFIFLFFIKSCLTCSFGWRALSRKDTALMSDRFLNNIVLNPYYALYSTLKDYKKRNRINGIEAYIKPFELQTALKEWFPKKNASKKLDDYLLHTIEKDPQLQEYPSHIFLILMESQDTWPLLTAYQDLKLTPNLNYFASKGIFVPSFLSSGVGTMPALNTLILGLPEVGIETQYQPSVQTPLCTSIPNAFKKLGYQTNFFYGGPLSWRKLGVLLEKQGFEGIYGQGHIKSNNKNEWGVNDQELFAYITQKVNPHTPSFNFILTTSNHPPFSIQLEKEGFHLLHKNLLPNSLKNRFDGTHSLEQLGHLWYADKCVGRFIKRMQEAYPKALFVITGDHWSRRFLNAQPSLYERKSVPLIFYSPNLLNNITLPKSLAGSHIDILPTLIELFAPKGFEYFSFGSNIFDPERLQAGFGTNAIITPEEIIDVPTNTSETLVKKQLNKYKNSQSIANNSELIFKYNALHGLGWWKIIKGNQLP